MGKLTIPRITSAQRLGYTPAPGELVYDTNINNVFSGDGFTVGGVILRNSNNSGGPVYFFATQAQYDAMIWSPGDIFIPTASGIVDFTVTSGAIAAHIDITWTNAERFQPEGVQVEAAAILGSDRFFTITGVPPVVPATGIPHIGFSSAPSDPEKINLPPALQGPYQQQAHTYATYLQTTIELDPTLPNGERRAELLEEVINDIPLAGSTGVELPVFNGTTELMNITNRAVLNRNCTVSRVGAQIVITSNFAGLNSDLVNANVTEYGTLDALPTVSIFQGQGSSAALTFLQNTIYIRRDGNNGWLVFNTAIRDFIEV